eukprot:TRINITY_DN5423_c0_g1_i7.p2 TRINITY_DN5423_c0_g1~~TRINITY_DN5423_c0_g1_i7.p2  ORF type:complete len:340 (-),score=12.72 TRINITY_DN5423_c0_g1_i7:208-1227(-)
MFNMTFFQTVSLRSFLIFVFYQTVSGGPPRYERDPSRERMIKNARDQGDTATLETTLSYMAICILANDEHVNIINFLKYHIYIGFSKVYVFDHGSQPPMVEVLMPYIESGHVSYMYILNDWKGDDYGLNNNDESSMHHNSVQRWVYTSCLRWFGHRHQFIANIDTDEYIILRDEEGNVQTDSSKFFSGYEEYSAVQLHWRMFGSSGRIQSTDLTPLIAYTQCGENERIPLAQRFSKSVVNTDYFSGVCHAHECGGLGTKNVDTLKRRWGFKRVQSNITWYGAFIHHYVIKSLEDYDRKIQRGQAHTSQKKKTWQLFHNINNNTRGNCTYMIPVAEKCCL